MAEADLRDYFAAKAMQGICATSDCVLRETMEAAAREAYLMADAMLAERSKP